MRFLFSSQNFSSLCLSVDELRRTLAIVSVCQIYLGALNSKICTEYFGLHFDIHEYVENGTACVPSLCEPAATWCTQKYIGIMFRNLIKNKKEPRCSDTHKKWNAFFSTWTPCKKPFNFFGCVCGKSMHSFFCLLVFVLSHMTQSDVYYLAFSNFHNIVDTYIEICKEN